MVYLLACIKTNAAFTHAGLTTR